MTSKQPPAFATWLLKQFGSGPDNETVLGDLAEQYLRKNSVMWYWRQALKAIPVSFFREIRAHKGIAARALLMGWIMWIFFGMAIFPLADRFLFGNGGWAFWVNPVLGGGILAMPVHQLMALRHHIYVQTEAGALLSSVVFPLIVGITCGWLVARFHRTQQTAVVLLFAGSMLLADLLLFGPSLIILLGPQMTYALNGPVASNVAASVLGILFGGGLFGDHSRTADPESLTAEVEG